MGTGRKAGMRDGVRGIRGSQRIEDGLGGTKPGGHLRGGSNEIGKHSRHLSCPTGPGLSSPGLVGEELRLRRMSPGPVVFMLR